LIKGCEKTFWYELIVGYYSVSVEYEKLVSIHRYREKGDITSLIILILGEDTELKAISQLSSQEYRGRGIKQRCAHSRTQRRKLGSK
jgi:hypothetical protein